MVRIFIINYSMIKSLEVNKQYLLKKKCYKEKIKRKKELKKHMEYQDKLRKQKIARDLDKKKQLAKKPKTTRKRKKTTTKWIKWHREEAYRLFQLYSRVKDVDSLWMVKEIETGVMMHFRKVCWGHVWSKSRYPHMIFIENNCWPQTKGWNYRQMDNVGFHYMEQIQARIWKKEVDKLIKISMDKELKHQATKRDISFYEWIIKKYTTKIRKIEKSTNLIIL